VNINISKRFLVSKYKQKKEQYYTEQHVCIHLRACVCVYVTGKVRKWAMSTLLELLAVYQHCPAFVDFVRDIYIYFNPDKSYKNFQELFKL